MTRVHRFTLAASLSLLSLAQAFGQQQLTPQPLMASAGVRNDSLPIAAGDTLTVHVFDVPELDQQHLRVTDDGQIPLLFLGPVKILGLTPGAASQVIADAYMEHNILRNAHISIAIELYSSTSSVTVFGYVIGASATAATTGVALPLYAPQPLLTILAMAGGLSDRASRTVTIQRRDTTIKPFNVFIPNNPDAALANQVIIYPGDIVVVPRAGIVYILGDVGHSSGVVMSEDGRISLMQALSQAGSPLPTAGLAKIMIFRKVNGQYQSLTENLGQMVKGKTFDVELQAEDVVWVPFSFGRNLLINGASIAAAVGSATASGLIYSH